MRIRLSYLLGVPLTIGLIVLTIGGTGNTAANESPASAQGVSMVNFSFSPDPITILVGTTVTWTNNATTPPPGTPHTTTSDTGVWDSGTVNPGGTFKFTFNSLGTFKYHCTFHQSIGMVGTITVVSPTATSSSTPTSTRTATATVRPTSTSTATGTPAITPTPCPSCTATPTATITPTPTVTPNVPTSSPPFKVYLPAVFSSSGQP